MVVKTLPTDELASIFARYIHDAETRLLQGLSEALAADMDVDDWVIIKARQFAQFHNDMAGQIGTDYGQIQSLGNRLVEEAATLGINAAHGTLHDLGYPATIANEATVARVLALAHEHIAGLEGYLTTLPGRILRDVDDVYRDITARAVAGGVTGVDTRREVTQQILNMAADKGITKFIAKDGKQWRMDTYGEMTARTALHRTALTGQITVWSDFGYTIVRVADAPRECPLCTPWENQLVSLDGTVGQVVIDDLDGNPHTVTVKATLTQAQEAGLHHPNCRHGLDPYIPEYTTLGKPESDPYGYELTQQQRYLERQVRKWERRAAAALDDTTETAALARLSAYEKQIEDLVESHPNLRRLAYREITPTPTPR